MIEWRTIDSAPRDGTPILVEDLDLHVVREVFWKPSWYGDTTIAGWMIANCDEEYGHYVRAIHWMPLPEPPPAPSDKVP